MSRTVVSVITVFAGMLASFPAPAQTAGKVIRVFTDPPGLNFLVDGQAYGSDASFSWPANTKHVITSYDQDQTLAGGQFVYRGWVTSLNPGGSPDMSQPITADPSLQYVKLVFDAGYLVTVGLVDCPEGQPCPSAGTVTINAKSYNRRTQFYLAANTTIDAKAFPADGYIFKGWSQVYGYGAPATAFNITFKLVGPTQLSPIFQPATAVQVQTNIQTIPPNMQVLVDRAPVNGNATVEWGWGTTHSLGANPVQSDRGISYVFESWSDGGAINHDVVVPSGSAPLSFIAKFVPGSYVVFGTSPAGLSLSIDGRQNWPEYSFEWAPGSIHKISAPANQTDSQGRRYRFVSWSNKQTASFDYTTGPAPGGDVVTAVYQPVGQTTITSVPLGLPIQVDGVSCTTPCALDKDVGVSISIAAEPMVKVNDRSRLVFAGWNDSADPGRVIQSSAVPKTITANYRLQNRLSVSVTPSEGASYVATPSSADGFYDADAAVSIAVRLALGFRFSTWSGDFSGTSSGAVVSMDSPHSAVLLLDRVPAIGPSGVRNAAAGTSTERLAPGSLISIFGANLAPDTQVGPSSPLSQTLQNVTVRLDDTFLPLVFVSPQQINAQLPATAAEGNRKLIVRWEGKGETTSPAAVVRNSPGLFNNGSAEQPLGAFIRANGAPVTADNPARANEIVTVLGTGMGPYKVTPPDGYVLDETSGYTLLDPVGVVAGDTPVGEILYAGRSAAGVGVDAVRFRVPATLPDAAFLTIKVLINGQESNAVLLPVTVANQEDPRP